MCSLTFIFCIKDLFFSLQDFVPFNSHVYKYYSKNKHQFLSENFLQSGIIKNKLSWVLKSRSNHFAGGGHKKILVKFANKI